MWGSQAIGGVVNVVTAVPGKPLEGSFDAEAGSRGTVSGRAGIGGTSERIDWRVAGNAFTTHGISAISPRYLGFEKDGYRNFGGSGRLDVRIADGVAADMRGYYSHGRNQFDASFGAPDTREYGTSAEWIGYAGLKVDLLDGRLKNRVAVTYSDINRDNYNPDYAPGSRKTFDADGHNRRFEYQGNLTLARNWSAVFGAETEKSTFRAAAFSPFFSTPACATTITTGSAARRSPAPARPGRSARGIRCCARAMARASRRRRSTNCSANMGIRRFARNRRTAGTPGSSSACSTARSRCR